MKILFIFTGGTIGSTMHGNVISTDQGKPRAIIEAYRDKYGIDFEYDTLEPYTELSENNTGEHINMLCSCVGKNLSSIYDGIIVTHGTDTLQYTAAALGYSLGLDTIPVCIVSANRPIENPLSNAIYNLHGAVCLIRSSVGRGVFVVYRNDKERKTKVHRATRLISGRPFSDEVASIFDKELGYFDEDFAFHKNVEYKEIADEILPIYFSSLTYVSESILFLRVYPGMRYPETDSKTRFVILDSYHSGTVDTKSDMALCFFEKAKKNGVKVFVCGITDLPEYESATLFDKLGLIPLKNISSVAAYVKLWGLSCTQDDIEANMVSSLGGDISAL